MSESIWKFLVASAASLLMPVLTACMGITTTPSPTSTPIIIVVTATPEPVQNAPSPTTVSLPSSTATSTSVSFQSGGLGLTEQEWRISAVPNLPKLQSINTMLEDQHISEISILYWEMGMGDGTWVPVTQARSDSKKLLPKDAVSLSEGLVYEHLHYTVAVDTYTSPSLASVFQSAEEVWEGAQPGTFNIEYLVTGPGNTAEASSMHISLGKRGPILTDAGIDPDVASKSMISGVYSDGVVNENDVNLRAGPGLNYESSTKLNKGVRVTIIGKDSTGEWLQVALIEQNFGWLMAKYVKVNVDLATVQLAEAPPVPTSTPKPEVIGLGHSYISWGLISVFHLDERAVIGYSDAGKRGKYVVVGVIVANEKTSGQIVSISPSYFRLVGKDGISVPYDLATYTFETDALSSMKLEPGALADGMIVFKVRDNFVPAKLVFEDFTDMVTIVIRNP